MAVTFPLAIPDELRIQQWSFDLAPMQELSPLRSGKVITKDLGPSLWRLRAQLAPLQPKNMGVVRAWFDALGNVETFYAYDPLRCYPLLHPGHTATATILSLPAGSKELRLSGLPVGMTLSPGDYLAFDYGTSRALHRIVNTTVADGAGQTPAGTPIEVRPLLRPGVETGLTVFLAHPAARMFVLPGTYSESIGPDRFGRISFEAIQTL